MSDIKERWNNSLKRYRQNLHFDPKDSLKIDLNEGQILELDAELNPQNWPDIVRPFYLNVKITSDDPVDIIKLAESLVRTYFSCLEQNVTDISLLKRALELFHIYLERLDEVSKYSIQDYYEALFRYINNTKPKISNKEILKFVEVMENIKNRLPADSQYGSIMYITYRYLCRQFPKNKKWLLKMEEYNYEYF